MLVRDLFPDLSSSPTSALLLKFRQLSILPVFSGASLCALTKKDGGIKPIAVGFTLRRLVVKGSVKFGPREDGGRVGAINQVRVRRETGHSSCS